MCKKLSSDFESKLYSLNQEKENEIEKLHAKIAQLQHQHKNAIFTIIKEKEVNYNLQYGI